MASQHRNKLVRRLPLRCFPVCWRALSIRSAMAFWTEARDEGKRHGGVTSPKSRCIDNIGHLRAEIDGSHGSGRLRCFDVVSAAAAQHGILVCATKSAIDEAGKGHVDRSPDQRSTRTRRMLRGTHFSSRITICSNWWKAMLWYGSELCSMAHVEIRIMSQ